MYKIIIMYLRVLMKKMLYVFLSQLFLSFHPYSDHLPDQTDKNHIYLFKFIYRPCINLIH